MGPRRQPDRGDRDGEEPRRPVAVDHDDAPSADRDCGHGVGRLTEILRRLASGLPLSVALRIAAAVARVVPPGRWAATCARDHLGVEPAGVADWCQRAWWGRQASLLIAHKLRAGALAEREVEALTDPPDWAPLDRLLARGRGVLVVGAHLGPSSVIAHHLVRRHPDVMILGDESRGVPSVSPRLLAVRDEAERTQVLGIARRRLRDGGIVYMAPDGRMGDLGVPVVIGGRERRIGRGAAVLARLAGSPTLPAVAAWHQGGHRLRLEIGAPFAVASDLPAADFDAAWNAAYATWLDRWLRGPAENVRVTQGVFRRTRGDRGAPRSSPTPSA